MRGYALLVVAVFLFVGSGWSGYQAWRLNGETDRPERKVAAAPTEACACGCGQADCGKQGKQETSTASPMCGPQALRSACGALGVKASADELAQLARAGERGTTILDLKRAAETKGLKATGLRVTFTELASIPPPLIAAMKDNHFVAILECTPTAIRIHDPPAPAKTWTAEEFQKAWTGYVLVVSRQ